MNAPPDIDPPVCSVVEGWTTTLGPFTIRRNGVPLNLTPYTVTIVLHRASGAAVTPGGVITPDPDQTTNPGQIYYTPVAGDFVWEPNQYTVHQPYLLHFRLQWIGGVVFAPSAAIALIMVNRA